MFKGATTARRTFRSRFIIPGMCNQSLIRVPVRNHSSFWPKDRAAVGLAALTCPWCIWVADAAPAYFLPVTIAVARSCELTGATATLAHSELTYCVAKIASLRKPSRRQNRGISSASILECTPCDGIVGAQQRDAADARPRNVALRLAEARLFEDRQYLRVAQ